MTPEAAALYEFLKYLDTEIQHRSGVISRGNATDYAHYREMVGAIAAFERAKTELKELLKKQHFDLPEGEPE